MSRSRCGSVVFAVMGLAVVMGGWFAYAFLSGHAEQTRIRVRYQQFRTALDAGDTNAVSQLFAPEVRARAHRSYGMVGNFALPLDSTSRISITGPRALVCPRGLVHFGIIPGGHTVEMVKVDGEWFFTGEVNID